MTSLVLLLLVAVAINSVTCDPLPEDGDANIHQEFEKWKLQHEKTYPSTEEETKRKELWLATRKRVMEHNLKAAEGLENYTTTMGNYADLSIEDVSPTEEELDKEFAMWKTKHGKTYNSTEEEAKRRNIWFATRTRVMEHNRKAANGLATWIMGLNHFSDLTSEERPRRGFYPRPRPTKEDLDEEFERWKLRHGKTYNSTEEEAKRKDIWLATRRRVMEHNKKAANGSVSWTMGLNQFSDMTHEEIPKGGLLPLPQPTEEDVDKEFETWKEKHGKTYDSSEEEAKRKNIWLATRRRVMEHNQKAANGSVSWTMGLNSFSDLTHEEIPKGVLLPTL
ncbi:uncharacterized protein LOC105019996 [Esox lucius]|uniref:Cystein proteinase inhibitor protein salarin n=1 Tax=Esox lucius TaxID=8010 RepID=A0A3P8Z4C2_ESOLU|nr:uncharacterized protein LOC105019996 [Esox lucius]